MRLANMQGEIHETLKRAMKTSKMLQAQGVWVG